MRPQTILNPKYAGDFVFESPEFYKGGGQAPKTYSPMEEAQAQLVLEREKEAMAQAQAKRDKEEAEAKKAADTARNTGLVNSAYDNAMGYARSKLSGMGLNDEYGILDAYQRDLDAKRSGIDLTQEGAASNINASALWDSAYNGQRSNASRRHQQELQGFADTGFEKQRIADTADDDIINAILGGQYDEALATLTRARDRGQINDSGFTTAQNELNNARTAGNAKLQDTGMGVLENYRKGLRDMAGGFYDRAENYDFGDRWDTDAYKNELDSYYTSSLGRMEGDIRNAMGGTKYFDTDAILGTAGKSQGAIGSTGKTSNPLAGAFSDQAKKKEEETSLSNVGAF